MAETAPRKPYGTTKGERKAARKARAEAKAAASKCPRISTAVVYEGGETEASRWDEFYKRSAFAYRDRHLVRGEFPELVSESCAIAPHVHMEAIRAGGVKPDLILLEVGCGHGSGLYAILRANPRLFALAFDFSVAAVELAQNHEEYAAGRVHAFVADVADVRTYENVVVEHGGAHFVTALWTLSALDQCRIERGVRGLVRVARAGALVFVRDFAKGDMRETRFRDRGHAVECTDIANVYRRGDGTLASFFDIDVLAQVFVDAGCEIVRKQIVRRDVVNRAKNLVMHRQWVQAVFRKVVDDGKS